MRLITVWVHGKIVSQCDARCYNARKNGCTCCCTGANHRVGPQAAMNNVRAWMSNARHTTPLDDFLRTQPADAFLEIQIPMFRLCPPADVHILPKPTPQEALQPAPQPPQAISVPPAPTAPTAHQDALQSQEPTP